MSAAGAGAPGAGSSISDAAGPDAATGGPKPLRATASPIAGLTVWDLPVHGDARGWFKENWQREKMTALGLSDFGPVQNNISFNDEPGTTRGIHAEPWDKLVSVASGRIFGAWVDLREGPGFGQVFTCELGPDTAVFVPRGVGNAYQTLEPNTAYTYLVNAHWSPDASYTFLNLADETAAIVWPIPLSEAVVSAKDAAHPRLAAVSPVPPRRTLVLGAGGQLGRALRASYEADGRGGWFAADPAATRGVEVISGHGWAVEFAGRAELDITGPNLDTARRWDDYDVIINAAAYTAVDTAETPEGRRAAWAANVTAVGRLARIATEHRITLVHVSSDYVFDGTADRPYREDDPVCPLGVYGQTKAAGDAIVAGVPRHYIVRTSWVIGDGHNFVDTMARLAASGVDPKVVDDQVGRPTTTTALATGIRHLLGIIAPYGTYNITGAGAPASWADVARLVFDVTGHDPDRVSPVTTEDYVAGTRAVSAPRPRNSVLDLAQIRAAGHTPAAWRDGIIEHLRHRSIRR